MPVSGSAPDTGTGRPPATNATSKIVCNPPSGRKTGQMDELTYEDSIVIAAQPDAVYAMISDVTRMGEWSPVCRACWWDDENERGVGAWFNGRNEVPERTWQTRSQVVAADGQEFAFQVNTPDGVAAVRWGYTVAPVEDGTQLTESWHFLPAGITFFHGRFGPDAPAEIAKRAEAARTGIPATLEAIRKAAESA